MKRFFFHLFIFGFAAPYLGAAAILSSLYLKEGMNPFEALWGALLAAWFGVVMFSPLLLPSAAVCFFVFKLIYRFLNSQHRALFVLTGFLWGGGTALLFSSVWNELNVEASFSFFVGSLMGIIGGLAVYSFWQPKVWNIKLSGTGSD